MGKLVSIIGNSGSGKTSLARLLGEAGGYAVYFEEHETRPYQADFAADRRFALANQVDYLLYRAEQERSIRQIEGVGIQDGGLDLDFQVFTRLFHQRGYLDEKEFALCERLYQTLRTLLPLPDLVISLQVPLEVISARKAARSRTLDISEVEDLQVMQRLLDRWIQTIDNNAHLVLDSTQQVEELVKACLVYLQDAAP